MSIRSRVAQPSFKTPLQEAMVGLLVAAGHLERRLEEVCEDHGLTHEQYNVLRILRGAHPEGHPRYAIAERLIHRAADVTRLLDRLERGGLVRRVRSDEDRRLSVARITPRGMRLLRRVDPRIAAAQEDFARRLTKWDVGDLVRISNRLLAAVNEEEGQASGGRWVEPGKRP